MSLRKVLLIEDASSDEDLLKRMLRMADSLFDGKMKIDNAGTWREAVEHVDAAEAKGEPYDAISCDLGLPDTGGPDGTIRELAGVSAQWPPVVVVTGYLDHRLRVNSLLAGAEAVVAKDEIGVNVAILWRRLHDEAFKRTIPRT